MKNDGTYEARRKINWIQYHAIQICHFTNEMMSCIDFETRKLYETYRDLLIQEIENLLHEKNTFTDTGLYDTIFKEECSEQKNTL